LGVTDAAQEIDPLQIAVKRFFVALGEEIDLSTEKYVHMIFQVPSASIGQQVFCALTIFRRLPLSSNRLFRSSAEF